MCEYSKKKVEDIWGPIGKRSMQVSVGVGENIHLSHLAMASEWKWDGCRIRSKSGGGWCMHALSVFFINVVFFLVAGFFLRLFSVSINNLFLLHGTARAAGTRAQPSGLHHTHSFILLSTADFQQHHGRKEKTKDGHGGEVRMLRAGFQNFAEGRAWISGRQLLG